MEIVIIIVVVLVVVYIAYSYRIRHFDIETIAKEIAKERFHYWETTLSSTFFITDPEDFINNDWGYLNERKVKHYRQMLAEPLHLVLSDDLFKVRSICHLIADPPPLDIIDSIIEEAQEIARSERQFCKMRHVVYVDIFHRITLYMTFLKGTENEFRDYTWYTVGKIELYRLTTTENRKIIKVATKQIPRPI